MTDRRMRSTMSTPAIITGRGPPVYREDPWSLRPVEDSGRAVLQRPLRVFRNRSPAISRLEALDARPGRGGGGVRAEPRALAPGHRHAARRQAHDRGADHMVPVVRTAPLRRYGRDLRRRLDAASRLLTTHALRGHVLPTAEPPRQVPCTAM